MDKREKNPFEQSSYVKKRETVDSFEKVMVITFKTIAQLSEANGEIRGVVRHGLGMAEKASKGVYKVEAFTRYDDSVRERAGTEGPGAFGAVDQEDFSAMTMSRELRGRNKHLVALGLQRRNQRKCANPPSHIILTLGRPVMFRGPTSS